MTQLGLFLFLFVIVMIHVQRATRSGLEDMLPHSLQRAVFWFFPD